MNESSYHALIADDADITKSGTAAKTLPTGDGLETDDPPPTSKPVVGAFGTWAVAESQPQQEESAAPPPESSGDGEDTCGAEAPVAAEQKTSASGTGAGMAPPPSVSSVTDGAPKVPNVALVSATSDVDPGVADIILRVRNGDYKGSPAERRKTVYADMERLRTRGIYLRDSAEDLRSSEMPDEAEAKRLVDRAKQCEQVHSELSAVYDELLSRAERRAGRDANLKALDRDPKTGKKWKGAYVYDPRRAEMQELYKEKTHPAHVFADGAKLIRMDGGQYGLIGSLLLVIHEAEQRAGESIPEKVRLELLRGVAYDALERGHGMGAGYNRDAAWILELWARETKTPLRIDDLPVRHPIKTFDDWVETEFPEEHAKALQRVGLKDATSEGAVQDAEVT